MGYRICRCVGAGGPNVERKRSNVEPDGSNVGPDGPNVERKRSNVALRSLRIA